MFEDIKENGQGRHHWEAQSGRLREKLSGLREEPERMLGGWSTATVFEEQWMSRMAVVSAVRRVMRRELREEEGDYGRTAECATSKYASWV